jgi:16S rRNA G1207 methylase RsmC
MNDRALDGRYRIRINQMEVLVDPGVYAPGFFTDSAWFADEISTMVAGRSVLEIGTGSGVIGLACAIAGCYVVATDINPLAVLNARANVAALGLAMTVREGDLYTPLTKNEAFDFIFWAHPFNNCGVPVQDMLLRSGMDFHYDSLRGYIEGASKHLMPGGKLLLGTGDSADLTTIERIAVSCGYTPLALKSATMLLEQGGNQTITYMIYQFERLTEQ